MSGHWRPDEDVIRARTGGAERVRSPQVAAPTRRAKRERLPEGAKPGLLLVAALSLGLGLAVDQLLGPRDVVAAGAEKHLAEIGRP